uniref:G-protein coupled receptors family 3 profile domain-containing protein n=1 Tax=Leptobrachium leishanense TaxID=445787 RepID=A0A8C5PEP7_9ANUR
MKILTGPSKAIPNYSCRQRDKLAGVIGDLSSPTTLQIANVLNLYGYAQISFGTTYTLLTNKLLYPSFYQMLQSDKVQTLAIVKLLKHFGWTWIGIIAADDDSGESQSRELVRLATLHGICIEFMLKTQPQISNIRVERTAIHKRTLKKSTSKIVVVCGSVSLLTMYGEDSECDEMLKKTFIIPASWTVHYFSTKSSLLPPALNGCLAFTPPSRMMPKLEHFSEKRNLASQPHDTLLEHMWALYFNCKTSSPDWNNLLEHFYKIHLHNCSRDIKMEELSGRIYNTQIFGTSYHVYKAVYALAQALNDMTAFFSWNSEDTHIQTYKNILQHFIRRVNFIDPTGEHVHVNENGEIPHIYNIRNYMALENLTILDKSAGIFNPMASEGKQLIINSANIMWKYNSDEIPSSRCSEDCLPGQRRVLKAGIHLCCFDCVQCSEGEISNQKDRALCIKCPSYEWPDETKENCIQKPTEYLSYDSDPICLIFSALSILLSILTSVVLGIFAVFRNTPIVKANNRNLSFLLLVSIMLSFLCVFLFLGRPVDITCMLRQTTYGIIFSVVVSSLLAKTIMVSVAFKATKPSSKWRKCVGVKIPIYVMLFTCSFVQVVICVSWLCISPPFQEMNTHSYPEKIIIQCNEGSAIAFYTVLGYMGFLAAVSFVVAFLARKLPDRFNEAKYITFSMLVFCNVWVTFIPAYVSVMGKNTVIVEVFAILSSSTGILGCIFFPKCYIILLKPKMNTRKGLLNY